MMSNRQEKHHTLEIAALAEDRLEPVSDLSAATQEVLFVMADTLRDEDVNALAACKERLSRAGGRPFFIRACHRNGESSGPAGLFDLTLVCGRDSDLPLDLPAETVVSMLCGDFPLDREKLLRPGRLVCFEHMAAWGNDPEGVNELGLSKQDMDELRQALKEAGAEERWRPLGTDPAQAVDELCRDLRREIDAARAEDGIFSRVLICATVSPDVGMDVLDRCASVLTEGGLKPENIIFQLEFMLTPPFSLIRLRGMIGTGS